MDGEPATYRFDAFALDTANRRLSRDGAPVELGSRYFDALVLLVREDGALVSKDRFMDEVWRGVPVTDEALTQCIRTLRRALGDDAANPRFIATVPKHGYRFLAAPARDAAPEQRLPLSRVAGVCTLAGLAAGVFAGLVYGAAVGTGGGARVLILAAMIGALGTLAGAGIGLGFAATMAWRGRIDATLVPGAAAGGLAVGAIGAMLGREGVGLLTGRTLGEVTGPFEGVLLGLATGLVAWLALTGTKRRAVIASALAAGAGAGAFVELAGGTLLGGSLWSLQQALSGTQLELGRIGAMLGERDFGAASQMFTATIEGAVFVLAIAAGLIAARRSTGD